MVSRLTSQKGFDLLEAAAAELLKEKLSLVILGIGEPRYEQFLQQLAADHPDQVAVCIRYDEVLAHKIIAGADLFLMPSRWEPCGLVQLYAMRYGTIPVVRDTGGLADTVHEAIGFKFKDYQPEAMLAAIRQALKLYQDPEAWRQRARRAMSLDFSWRTSAQEYARLYESLISCNE